MVCISCNNKDIRKVINIKKRNIYECNLCGLAFVWPIPSEKQVKKVIDKISVNFYGEYVKEKEYYDKYFSSKIEEIKDIINSGQLLDIGCGPGTFLKIAKKSGFKVSGVDLSPNAVNYCKEEGLIVYQGTIDSKKLKNKKFDVITAFQVLEHIKEPDIFLNSVYRHLKKGGVLLLTTPDKEGIAPRILGKKWYGYYNLEHIYYFTKRSLTSLFFETGYEIITNKREPIRSINFEYIYNRMANYYYTPGTKMNKEMKMFSFLPKFLSKVSFKVPWASVSIIARKN